MRTDLTFQPHNTRDEAFRLVGDVNGSLQMRPSKENLKQEVSSELLHDQFVLRGRPEGRL